MRFNEQFWDSGQFFSYICAVFLREGAAGHAIGSEEVFDILNDWNF